MRKARDDIAETGMSDITRWAGMKKKMNIRKQSSRQRGNK